MMNGSKGKYRELVSCLSRNWEKAYKKARKAKVRQDAKKACKDY